MLVAKGMRFPIDVILVCIRWYAAYPLSYRHLEEMMQERGVCVDHSTINRWAVQFLPLLENALRKHKRPVGANWRMDETYIKVKGIWKYLYRAVDKEGNTVDFLLTATTTLFAALEVASGKVIGQTSQTKTRKDFLAFMDEVAACAATGKVLHIVMDNLSTHKKCDDWLARHPNVTCHYTPTSASWLNQIEIWFGIFTRQSLKGASFASVDALVDHISAYLNAYNQNPVPFAWKKREVRDTQLRNTARNLSN